eukprot:6220996-Pyramimonas_sp.AAC.1
MALDPETGHNDEHLRLAFFKTLDVWLPGHCQGLPRPFTRPRRDATADQHPEGGNFQEPPRADAERQGGRP